MKTLVTGANGHLGANLVRELLREGRQVRALVRPKADLRGLKGLDVEIANGDILDEDSVLKALQGCESLFHTAAAYRYWHPTPRVILETAVEGTRKVLSAAHRCGKLQKIVYTSSVAAVGFCRAPHETRNENHFNEEKVSVYNEAKTVSEELARATARLHGLPLVVVNPATILGSHDYKPTPSGQLILQFLKKGAPVYWDGGMNLVDVEDVARGHLLAEKRGRVGERYILGGDNLSMLEIYRALARLTGRRAPLFKMGRRAAAALGTLMELGAKITGKEPLLTREYGKKLVGKYAFFDCGKACSELGYHPAAHRTVLAKGLDWFLNSEFVSEKIRSKVYPHYRAHLEKIKEAPLAAETIA